MDDLISRQALIEAINAERKWVHFNVNHAEHYHMMNENSRIIGIVWNLPSVFPEQKTSTFYVDSEGYERCSACNEHESGMRYFNFCPNCGAKMGGV